jgi:hypothetical protein
MKLTPKEAAEIRRAAMEDFPPAVPDDNRAETYALLAFVIAIVFSCLLVAKILSCRETGVQGTPTPTEQSYTF